MTIHYLQFRTNNYKNNIYVNYELLTLYCNTELIFTGHGTQL